MRSVCLIGASLLVLATGCVHHVKVDPVKIEPIYVTMDIRIKIDRQLDEFFNFEEEIEEEVVGTPESGEPEKK